MVCFPVKDTDGLNSSDLFSCTNVTQSAHVIDRAADSVVSQALVQFLARPWDHRGFFFFFSSLDLHFHSCKVKGLVSGIRACELALYPSPPAVRLPQGCVGRSGW